jgi:hypothetical protein
MLEARLRPRKAVDIEVESGWISNLGGLVVRPGHVRYDQGKHAWTYTEDVEGLFIGAAKVWRALSFVSGCWCGVTTHLES